MSREGSENLFFRCFFVSPPPRFSHVNGDGREETIKEITVTEVESWHYHYF